MIPRTMAAAAILFAVSASGAPVAEKQTLTIQGARKVIHAAVSQALRNNAGGVIAVVDDGGNLMALERLDGTFAAGANIAIGKARTAALFQRPTKFFEDVIAKGRTSMVALPDFTPLQGGVPVVMGGRVVGAIGVSGANSAAQDEEFAMAGASALNETAHATYFDARKVDDAFAKGAVLFDDGEKYMVHASRRDKPGMAEIHINDADVVRVLRGTAALVTGGRATGLKQTGPDEFRGDAIEGGEEREIREGDVIVIPAGTPHWFKRVTDPFLYYVVKAR